MDDREEDEKGLDTTYVGIMLVVFLALAALAIDIGYMYVSEEDLQGAAETAALTGAQAIEQQLLAQLQSDPAGVADVTNDPVQTAARTAAIEAVVGKHRAVALTEIVNNNTNRLTTENDLTVGFWNVSTHTYIPGGTPVNAMQVRTRRTAESETVGLGSLGNILAKISGIQKFDYTPEATAAFPPRADTNFALCAAACDSGCTYPNVCSIRERRMVRGKDQAAGNRYAYTSLLYPPSDATRLSDLICMEMPPQEVCGKEIHTIQDTDDGALRDMESMMYNPNADKANKEYDKKTGDVVGWWVIAPVTDCPQATKGQAFGRHTVTRYALVRIRKICVPGPATGCRQNDTAFDAPAAQCGGDNGLYIDRISCISCSSRDLPQFPGLHPVLVK